MNYPSRILVLLLLCSQNAIQSFDQKNLYAAAGIGALTLVGMHWFSLHQHAKKITAEKKEQSPFTISKSDLLKNYLQPHCPILSSFWQAPLPEDKINETNGDSIKSKKIFTQYKFPFLFSIEHTLNVQHKIINDFGKTVDQDSFTVIKHSANVKPVFYTVPLLSFFAGWMCARIAQFHPKKI